MPHKIRFVRGVASVALFGVTEILNAQVPSDPLGALSDKTVQIRVDGRAVREASSESGNVSLDSLRVKVRAGDEVRSLLRRQGVVPDASAIATFYELNPAVHNADQLVVGTSVLLPAVTAPDAKKNAAGARLSFAVVADTVYKTQLIDQASRITRLTDSLQTRSKRSAEARSIDANGEQIARAVQTLSKASIPLSRESAAELSLSLNAYETWIQRALATAEPAQAKLTVAGKNVAGQATALATAVAAGTNSQVELNFMVIDTAGKDRSNVKVVYARPMFENDSSHLVSFVKRSEASIRNAIELGPWKFWVEELGGKLVSAHERKEIKSTMKEVTLIAR